MKKEIIQSLHSQFESLILTERDTGLEFWLARDLQAILGYDRWENFLKVIRKAQTACTKSGFEESDHFLESTREIQLGSGAKRVVVDYMLTRYACYLIAQNGNPSKEAIAFAQTYFALQTRKQELIEQRLEDAERLDARRKLTLSEKQLSGLIYERLGDDRSFGLIRSKGDQALFGGLTTNEMKARMGVPQNRPLADFLPTITIKGKDFANEITNFSIMRDDLKSEPTISKEHVKNNRDVRKLLLERDIVPEKLPAAEDVKKVERRHKAEERKIPHQASKKTKRKGLTE